MIIWYGAGELFEKMPNPLVLSDGAGRLEMEYRETLPQGESPSSREFQVLDLRWLKASLPSDQPFPGNPLARLLLVPRGGLEAFQRELAEKCRDFIVIDFQDPSSEELTALALRLEMHLQILRQYREYKELMELQHQQISNLVENLPDIIYQLDGDGYFTFISQTVSALGYSPEDLLGSHFSAIIAEDEVPLVSRETILRSFAGKHTGDEFSPGLFDERRGPHRRTERLEVRLRVHPHSPQARYHSHRIASVTAYGEVCCRGFSPVTFHPGGPLRDDCFDGTVGIIRDITEQRESRRHLQMLFQGMDQTPQMAAILSRRGRLEYANPAFYRHFSLAPGDDLPPEEECPENPLCHRLFRGMRNALFTEARQSEEITLPDNRVSPVDAGLPPGGPRWYLLESSPIQNPDRPPESTLFIITDITADKEREEGQRLELAEKERLLDEIHHRIKNNLQVVSSFLHMQEGSLHDSRDVSLLRESQARIRSMALIHDQLNHTQSKTRVALAPFLEGMTSHLIDLYVTQGRAPEIVIDVPEIEVEADQLTPLSLLINEIISNSLKYAFPPEWLTPEGLTPTGDAPRITLALEKTSRARALRAGDNGCGSPYDPGACAGESLGLQLMQELSFQVGSGIERLDQPGTLYRIPLRIPSAES